MTRDERLRFIDEELKGLWPRWDPTEAEIRVWLGVLGRYTYDVARAALQQYFCEQAGNYHRPKPASFRAKARLLAGHVADSRRQHECDLDSHVFLECTEPPAQHPNRLGIRTALCIHPASRQNDLDCVRTCVETVRQRFEQLYGGRWITVIEKPQPPEENREPLDRTKAHAAILNGPDTPGKRWLQHHLTRKASASEHETSINQELRHALHS